MRALLAGADRLPGEVEVEQHRLAVGRQQHVGRLEVEVDQAALVGVLQGIGQAGADPADRLDVGGPGQGLPGRPPGRRDERRARPATRSEGLEQVLPGAPRRRHAPHRLEQLRQRGAAEVGHAQHAEAAGRVVLDGVERDDVGVLQAGQRQVLVALARA